MGMTRTPRVISPDRLAVEAVRIVEEWEVSALIAVEDDGLLGMVHIHEILKAGWPSCPCSEHFYQPLIDLIFLLSWPKLKNKYSEGYDERRASSLRN